MSLSKQKKFLESFCFHTVYFLWDSMLPKTNFTYNVLSYVRHKIKSNGLSKPFTCITLFVLTKFSAIIIFTIQLVCQPTYIY